MSRKISKTKKAGLKREQTDKQELRRLGVLMEQMDDKLDLVAEQHGDIIKTLKSHTEIIGSIAEDVAIIKMDIEFIKGSLRKKVDIEEFTALERRVSVLEKRR